MISKHMRIKLRTAKFLHLGLILAIAFVSAPALGQDQKDPTHTANFGLKLQEKCKSLGVDCELVYPGAADVKHKTVDAYLIESLKLPSAKQDSAK